MSRLLCGSWTSCRSQRIQYKLCLLVHKMFAGHASDYIASLSTPASDIPSRSSLRLSRNCDLVVPRTSRKIGDSTLSLLPHPVLGIGCRPTWNSCIRLHHSRANWRVFCSWCLCHQSDCRRCTTSHLCYCYNMLRNTLPRRKLHFYQTMTCDFHPFWQCDAGQIPLLSVPTQSTV